MAEFVTVLVGIVAMCVPLLVAIRFLRDYRGFGIVLAGMLLGESIAMATTLEFAIHSYIGDYLDLSRWDLVKRRLLIFSTALISI